MKFKELIAYDDDEKREWELSDKAFTLIIFAVWVIALNLLAVIFITRGSAVYFWDNAGDWNYAKSTASGALLPDVLKSVYASISSEEYNCLASLPSALFIKLFGPSRLVYILTLVNLYIVPSAALIYLLAKKLGKAPMLTMSIALIICPALVYMAFSGYAEVGGVLGALACLWLYFDKPHENARNKSEKRVKPGLSIWKCLLIGVILTAMMLWRRWYAFFAVSFVTAMIADSIINKKRVYPAFISAATAALLLVFLFRDFLMNFLLAGYGEAGLFTRGGVSPVSDLKLMARYFGLIYIALLAAATVYGAVKRRELRTIFMWVQMIVCAVMLTLLQTHEQQHMLLYVPSLILLTIFAVRAIDREWMLALMCAAAAACAVSVYIPRAQPQNAEEIKILPPLPSFSLLPKTRADAYEILELKSHLDSVIGQGETLGVLASSYSMNAEMLKNVYPSLGAKGGRTDYAIIELPMSDNVPYDITVYGRVNYVLTVNPPQLMSPDTQRVASEALASFAVWADIATAYEELYDFTTQIGDMEIKLFRRVRDIPDFDYRTLMWRCAQNQ